MSNSVTQTEIKRAIKAILLAGMPVEGVELSPDGKVRVVTATEKVSTDDEALEKWMNKDARKT